jgi:hypothetical protein
MGKHKPKRHTRIYMSFKQWTEYKDRDILDMEKDNYPDEKLKAGYVLGMLWFKHKLHFIIDEYPVYEF